MSHHDSLTTAAIQEIFAGAITALGGTVTESIDDGERLLARSVLPREREVLPDDRMQHGVALRATRQDIWIHPYVFRQICSNGAIIAHIVETERIDGIEFRDPDQVASAIREAVSACCAEERFRAVAAGIRSASRSPADLVVGLIPLLSRLSGRHDTARLLGDIMERFLGDPDSSRFGLANAVTSVARDTSDPDTRWRLEEFGGEILSGQPAPPALEERRATRPAKSVSLIA